MMAGLALHFPEFASVPESKRHLELRTLAWQFLKLAFSAVAAVGCDQFVYWDETNPRLCLAPDAFVCFGEPDSLFATWKTWERGVPQVAVEFLSKSEHRAAVPSKLAQYQRLGVSELVLFDAEAEHPLRIWDWIAGQLVERLLTGSCAESRYLPGFWLVQEQPALGAALRLSRDAQGEHLYLTPAERDAKARAEAEAQRAGAEARIRELEAELARRHS